MRLSTYYPTIAQATCLIHSSQPFVIKFIAQLHDTRVKDVPYRIYRSFFAVVALSTGGETRYLNGIGGVMRPRHRFRNEHLELDGRRIACLPTRWGTVECVWRTRATCASSSDFGPHVGRP
jgi:hypothetical protein